jgi:hypothetical protein
MKIKGNPLRDEGHQKRRNDLISALETIESREKIRIKVTIPYETAEKVRLFLKEKGILEGQGIPLLIQYGLSSESEEELEGLKREMNSKAAHNLWGEYAVMKFKAYEYLMENKVMVMRLSNMLYENRLLKRRLQLKGLQKLIPKDEWDGWDESVIDSYYHKYVFGKSPPTSHGKLK